MKVAVVIIAYTSGGFTKMSTDSVFLDADKHDITLHLFRHSNHDGVLDTCNDVIRTYGEQVVYYDYGYNRGVAASWNDGMINGFENGADTVIIMNDDIELAPGDLDKMSTKAKNNRKRYIVSAAGYHMRNEGKWQTTHGYSCYALNPISLEKIGCFDENIFPAYMEDCDHHFRAGILDLVETNCDDTKLTHHGSMATELHELLRIQNLVTQKKNGMYYSAKWGGINGMETRTIPFNDKRFGAYIHPEVRHAPYPGYNRDDHGTVTY